MFGHADGLQIELHLEPASVEGLAEGRCRIFLDGEPVWVGEGDGPDGCGEYLNWTWVDLLAFLGRHDLASAPKGLFLSSLIIMRQGETAQISAPGLPREVIRPWHEVETALEAIGEQLCSVCAESTQPRARQAVDWWQERQQRTADREWSLTTRLEDVIPAGIPASA